MNDVDRPMHEIGREMVEAGQLFTTNIHNAVCLTVYWSSNAIGSISVVNALEVARGPNLLRILEAGLFALTRSTNVQNGIYLQS